MAGYKPRKLTNFNSITQAWRWLNSAAGARTADTGSVQNATPDALSRLNRFTTVGTAGDCVTLPPALPGAVFWVKNAAAANSMDVFPSSGETINALSANAAFALAAGKGNFFVCTTAGAWDTVAI